MLRPLFSGLALVSVIHVLYNACHTHKTLQKGEKKKSFPTLKFELITMGPQVKLQAFTSKRNLIQSAAHS